jgi:hypothetical protein
MPSIFIFAQFENAAFNPEMTRLMGVAFDRACFALEGALLPGVVQETMANRIIEEALAGECNPDQLSKAALQGIGL